MRFWPVPVFGGTFACLVMAIDLGWIALPIKRAEAQPKQPLMEILHVESMYYGSGMFSTSDQLVIMRDRERGNLCYVFVKKMACIEQPRPVEHVK